MSSKSWFLLAIVLVFASAAAAAVPTDYQGYWKFDDGSGSIANDSSVNGNDGNLFGNPVWSTGKLNGALQFDGVGDYVNLGTSSFGLTSGSSTQLSINLINSRMRAVFKFEITIFYCLHDFFVKNPFLE